ncbi:MAG: hypothetical protein U0528_08665 [Anaerolineae bacterium]
MCWRIRRRLKTIWWRCTERRRRKDHRAAEWRQSRFDPSPVTPEDRKALRERCRIGDWDFVLAVGTVQPRKNYERLIRALAALPNRCTGRGW